MTSAIARVGSRVTHSNNHTGNIVANIFKNARLPALFAFSLLFLDTQKCTLYEMKKDFDGWNKQKKIIETAQKNILFKEGEVWWCTVGHNVGEESCGKGEYFRRPIIIIKKLSGKNCIGIPLSTQPKSGSWFCEIHLKEEKRWALLYQIRMFSVLRFNQRLATLEYEDFLVLRKKLEALLEFSSKSSPESNSGSVGYPKNNSSIPKKE